MLLQQAFMRVQQEGQFRHWLARIDGVVAFYTITSLPPANEGSLYINNVIINDLAQLIR
jgi:hypothetical protein